MKVTPQYISDLTHSRYSSRTRIETSRAIDLRDFSGYLTVGIPAEQGLKRLWFMVLVLRLFNSQ